MKTIIFDLDNPFHPSFFNDFYNEFEKLVASPEDKTDVERLGREWIASQNPLRYSGFFKPYFRVSSGGVRHDNKAVLQVTQGFLNGCVGSELQVDLRPITLYFNALIKACTSIFTPMLRHVLSIHPELEAAMLPADGEPSFAARVIRYEGDGFAGTNFHVDKSAFTCILHASDWGEASRLILVDNTGVAFGFGHHSGIAAGFFGAALQEAGYPEFPPLVHAVQPVEQGVTRFSTILFLLHPRIDLSLYNTSRPGPKTLRSPRQYPKCDQATG